MQVPPFYKGLLYAIPIALILWALIIWGAIAAFADEPAPIPFTSQERQAVLQMCEAARWAARIQFDSTCDQLKAKFAEADKKPTPEPKEK